MVNELIVSGLEKLPQFIPLIISISLFGAVQYAVAKMSRTLLAQKPHQLFRLQVLMIVISLCGLIGIIFTIPVSDELQGQLVSLLGLLVSGAIAFSSTTFIGNILAGAMIRVIGSIRVGDFITVNSVTGRISDMSLLHVEVQTEESDLVTIPNSVMVSEAVKVVRSSGTIITAEVSLGYDISHTQAKDCLMQAITQAGFATGFVHIKELGDFSIVYKVAAHLTEVQSLLTSRSDLRAAMLDSLHSAGIEIVSPRFMNQRLMDKDTLFIPKNPLQHGSPNLSQPQQVSNKPDQGDEKPQMNSQPQTKELKAEDVMFEKADSALELEKSKDELLKVQASIKTLTSTPEYSKIELEQLESLAANLEANLESKLGNQN